MITWLSAGGSGWVRVNADRTPRYEADADARVGLPGLRGIVVPKAESPEALVALAPGWPEVRWVPTVLSQAVQILARRLGFGGKACVHPRQIATVAKAFRPSSGQLAWARATLAAADGDGAAGGTGGVMIDKPVLDRARRIPPQSAGRGPGLDA